MIKNILYVIDLHIVYKAQGSVFPEAGEILFYLQSPVPGNGSQLGEKIRFLGIVSFYFFSKLLPIPPKTGNYMRFF